MGGITVLENNGTVLTSVMPGLAVADLKRSVTWYAENLGFVVRFTNGEPPVFAILERDGVELSLGTAGKPSRIGQGGIYLKLRGVDAIYEVLKERVEVVHPLKDEAYGMRECMVKDPDGNTINLGERI